MLVINGFVFLIEEGIVWYIVFFDVVVDLFEGLGDEGVDFDDVFFFVKFDDGNGIMLVILRLVMFS